MGLEGCKVKSRKEVKRLIAALYRYSMGMSYLCNYLRVYDSLCNGPAAVIYIVHYFGFCYGYPTLKEMISAMNVEQKKLIKTYETLIIDQILQKHTNIVY